MRTLTFLAFIIWAQFAVTSWAKPTNIPPKLSLSGNIVIPEYGTPYNSYHRRHPNPSALSYLSPAHLNPSTLFPRSTAPPVTYLIPYTTLAINFETLTVIPNTNLPLLVQAALKSVSQRGKKYGIDAIIPASPTTVALHQQGFTLRLEGSMTYRQALQTIENVGKYMQEMGYGTVNFEVVNIQDGESHPLGKGAISR